MKIQESAENYLETILILRQRIGAVRSIDIVNELEFSKPSVSVAMKNLRENGYIEMDTEGYITLTDKGRAIAETIYERHTLISRWLITLGVHTHRVENRLEEGSGQLRLHYTLELEGGAAARQELLLEVARPEGAPDKD